MSVTSVPVGGTRRFLVKMDNKPFASFDTFGDANRYVAMQKSKVKGNSRDKAYAAEREWTVMDRGGDTE